MFLEIFCLGSLASVLFHAGKATSGSLSRKLKTASYDCYDDDFDIGIEDKIRNMSDETGYCQVMRAYDDHFSDVP